MKRPSNLKSALGETPNLVGLASAFALSAALLNPLPLLAALAVEAAYLLFVPDSKWYRSRVERRYDAEVKARREELKRSVFGSLSGGEQVRFLRLETQREEMDPGDDNKPYYRDILRKLDYLLEKFLLFAAKRTEFQSYLKSMLEEVNRDNPATVPREFRDDDEDESSRRRKGRRAEEPPRFEIREPRSDDWVKTTVKRIQDHYAGEIETMTAQHAGEENLHTQALLDKRIEIAGRRSLYVARIGEILSNMTHQLQLMEDTFGLISDEMRARSPEQVIADIDTVVNQSDNLTSALQEVAPFDVSELPEGADRLYNLRK